MSKLPVSPEVLVHILKTTPLPITFHGPDKEELAAITTEAEREQAIAAIEARKKAK